MLNFTITPKSTLIIFYGVLLLPIVLGVSYPAVAGEDGWDETAAVEYLRPIGPEPHPHTIDHGRFQLEVYPASFTYDRHNDDNVRSRGLSTSSMLKYGIRPNVDLQIEIEAFLWERANDLRGGGEESSSGFGDIILRTKWNLWGNDEEQDTAFALYPFLRLPTNRHGLSSGAVEGGILFPFAWMPNDVYTIETTPHIAVIRDGDDRQYELEIGNLLVINRELTARVAGFVEIFNSYSSEGGNSWMSSFAFGGSSSPSWNSSIGVGANYSLNEDTVFEVGYARGITRATIDHNVYCSIIRRF